MADNQQDDFYKTPDQADVHTEDQEFADAVQHGVMEDKLDYKKLWFWSGLIIVMVALFIIALIYMYDYTAYLLNERAKAKGQFNQIQQLKSEQREKLSSFGVVNAEQNVYRIPIDSAINIVAVDTASHSDR